MSPLRLAISATLFILTAQAELGAQLLVTSNAESGAGTLREALSAAAASPGPSTIKFDPSVFTGATPSTNTITLISPLAVADADGVTIDGSDIPGGITVHGDNTQRLFTNAAGSGLTLIALNLTSGNSGNAPGGAILNQGSLQLSACALFGNTSGSGVGSAVASQGAGNVLDLRNCTIASNTGGAAAVHLTGTQAQIQHATISLNHGTIGTGGCGGLSVTAGSQVVLLNSIVAANTAAGTSPPDLNGGSSTLTISGVNLIGVRAGGFQAQLPAGLPNAAGQFVGTAAAPVSPDLQPLGRTRGPTLGLAPRRTSLAVDRIANPPFATDQSGEPRVDHGLADIGALEGRFVFAEEAWDVRISWKAGLNAGLASTGGQTFSVAGATHRAYTAETIAFRDDVLSPDHAGYFLHRQRRWPMNDETPQGQADGNDDQFYLNARCYVTVTAEDDYTFGFASDDGARLRLFSTNGGPDPAFASSTPLNPFYPTPVHFGNVLIHDGPTGYSDTLGVVHLLPGTYLLEFDYVENTGFSHAEVFAARGAKTALDGTFRLLGDRAAPLALRPPPLTPAGWAVQVLRLGATSLDAGIISHYDGNAGSSLPEAIMSLRFTSGVDRPERDPLTFLLEGSLTPGVWVTIASGPTQLPLARSTAGPVVPIENVARYQQLRLTFPTLRDPLTATAVQLGEVELRSPLGQLAFGDGVPTQPVPAASLGSQGPAAALDGDPASMFVHPAGANAGFLILPPPVSSSSVTDATAPEIRFFDPEDYTDDSGHGQPQTPFPGNRPGADDYFTTVARGQLLVSTAGDYTFAVEAAGESRLRIVGSRGWQAVAPPAGTALALVDGFRSAGTGDALGQVRLVPGVYEIELFHHTNQGPANLGLWAAAGRHERFDADNARYFAPVGSAVPGSGVESEPIGPTVRPPDLTRPVNDDFANALLLTGLAASASGSNRDATLETNEVSTLQATRTVWWKWTAPVSGSFYVDTFGSDSATVLSVYTGSAVDTLAFQDGRTFSDLGNRAGLPFLAVAGTTYYFQVGVRAGVTPGQIQLHLAPATIPANDDFASAIDLGSQSPVTVTGNILNGSAEEAEASLPLISTNTPSGNVWYRWTAPFDGKFLIDVRGSGFAADLGVYTGSSLATLVPQHQVVGQADGGLYCVLEATANTTYAITVDQGAGSAPNYTLNIAYVGRHQIFRSPILEDDGTFLLTYLGDAAYQRSPRLTASSSNPALLPSALPPGQLFGVLFIGLAPIVGADVAPAPDQFGSVTFSHALTFDRVPVSLAFDLTVLPVNDAPNFNAGPNLVTSSLRPQVFPGWASGLTAGPANESGQTLTFSVVANSNPSLFVVPPSVALDGTLSYTPAAHRFGTATITLRLEDNGGTANGGQNRRERSFSITTTNSPYTAWAQAAFGAANSGTGPGDDFDGDGRSNLLEYAFHQPPASSAPPAPTPGGLRPTVPVMVGQTLRFTRWTDPAAAGLAYSVEESADLLQWSPSIATPVVLEQDGDLQTVAYAPSAPGPRRFLRVVVSLVGP
ncbi:MAG: hypothetical protein JSR82_21380 [Verrucomicrobia bacterium]|nr:hypothetical protein [Verrucomicrobiota bacterium]